MKIRFIKDYFSDLPDSLLPKQNDLLPKREFKKGEVVIVNWLFGNQMIKEGYAVIENLTPKELIKLLGLSTKQRTEINFQDLNPKLKAKLENKKLINDLRDYFSDKKITIKDIAELYLIIFEYAIDKKKLGLLQKILNDIETLLFIVSFYERSKGK